MSSIAVSFAFLGMLLKLLFILYEVLCCYGVIVSGVPSRQKRRGGNQATSKETQAIYHKMTEVLENIALLVEMQPLTDTILLMVSVSTLILYSCVCMSNKILRVDISKLILLYSYLLLVSFPSLWRTSAFCS